MTMKEGDLLRVTACGPESNPKESGWYSTINAKQLPSNLYFDHILKSWWISEIVRSSPAKRVPVLWLKPVGKTEEEIQEEAWNASRAREEKPMGMLAKFRWFKFQQWRSEYLKQQGL